MNNGGGAAPTGCYKCGRPGHWSRDCPHDPNSVASSATDGKLPPKSSSFNAGLNANAKLRLSLPIQKPKPKRTRPKLTPELLLSDAGIGSILRYFPKSFKYRGRGHEVDDLGNLISLYAEWHSRLLPYFNFDQFIHKVEQVGATRRVKVCLGDLRDKVSHGMAPTELHELQVKPSPDDGKDADENLGTSINLHEQNEQNECSNNLSEVTSQGLHEVATKDVGETCAVGEILNQNQISDEQKVRMEANKRKALEKAAARSRSLQL